MNEKVEEKEMEKTGVDQKGRAKKIPTNRLDTQILEGIEKPRTISIRSRAERAMDRDLAKARAEHAGKTDGQQLIAWLNCPLTPRREVHGQVTPAKGRALQVRLGMQPPRWRRLG